MFKRSLSRNTRAKGIKMKHVLQILVLLGICIWVIFQVKHSRDKKKELNDEDEKLSGKMQNDSELLKLGRKDLDPREEKLDTGEKQDEEDEEEHVKEEENQDREERKHEETENDENDRVKSDNEPDKEKDDGEGETERDEKQVEEENSLEERDRDENTRGAREEHYKGDDASSAVAHDAHSIVSQIEEVISDLNNLEHEEKSSDRTTENGNSTQDGSPQNSILNTDLNGRNPEANDPDQVRTEASNDSTQNPVSANVSVEEENSSEERDRDENTRGAREEHYKGDDASSAVAHDARSIVSQTEEVISDWNNLEHEEKSSDRTTENGNSTQDGSPQNSILNTDLNGRNPEANDPDQVRTEAGNDSTQNPVSANVSVGGTTGNDPVSDNTHSDQNLTISSKDETGNGTVVVLSNSTDETKSIRSSEIGSGPSESEGNVGTEPGEEGVGLKNRSENPARDDHVNSSNSLIAHEMHETRMDLDTVPEIRTEIDSSDETAAE